MPLNPQIPLAAVAGMNQAQPFDPMRVIQQGEQIQAYRAQQQDRDALARLREQQLAASEQKMGLDERQAGIEANNAILKGKQEEAQLWDAVGPYVSFLLKSGARDPETYKEVHPLLAGITTMFPKESAQAMAGLLPPPEQYDPAQTPKVLNRLALFAGMKSKELNEWQTAVQAKQTALGRDMMYDEVMPVVQDLAKAKHVESAAAQGWTRTEGTSRRL